MLSHVSGTDHEPSRAKGRLLLDRLAYLAAAAGVALVLALARWLTPSPSGIGTHEQLGLPPCTFYLLTGHGCPGCGLTTAFAAMAHGDLSGAWRANPMGVFLFSLFVLTGAYSAYRVARPRPIDRLTESRGLLFILAGVMLGSLLTWLIRLGLGQV